MFTKKVVIAGCIRDCATTLPRVLRNIRRISDLYAESAFIFVEDDSQDSTKEILQAWRSDNPKTRLIMLDGLGASCPIRTIRLEKARNLYLSAVRSGHLDYHHLIVMDFDEVNAGEIDIDAVRRATEFLDSDPRHAGVFANQDGPYYDLWALRHPTLCPGDVWEDVFDCVVRHRLSDQAAFDRIFSQRMLTLSPDAEPLEVTSAFGGLGIYKIRSVVKNRQSYIGHKNKWVLSANSWLPCRWQTCEHVSFNAGFVERGERLFVMPYLVNCSTQGLQFNPSSYRHMLLEPEPGKTSGAKRVPKIERNAPCPCGSGKKFKHCHGAQVR